MDRVKVGVIGVGRMGKNHCRVYSSLRNAELAGIYDMNPDAGRKIAQQYQTQFYANLDDLLEQVDAVSLATPTPVHFDTAMHCLEKGVHVLVEKPVTEKVEQAEVLARAAAASGLVVMVGHIERFNPAYTELKGVLEELNVVAIDWRRLSPYAGSNVDVDVVLDLMIHDTDLVLNLVGREPHALNAVGLQTRNHAIDHAVVQITFDAGPLLTLTASRVTEQKVRCIDVTALEAYVVCDLLNKSISVHKQTIGQYLNQNHRGVKYRQESVVERIQVPNSEPLMLELQHFIDCILEKRLPQVTAVDGLKALRLAEQIRQTIYAGIVDMRAKPGLAPQPAATTGVAAGPVPVLHA
jgi:predicted dehydrogenase